MRTLIILLVLANLTLLAYTLLDRRSAGESARLAEQVRPDKIKLLSPKEVAQLGPAKVAALPDVCAEWGPFGDAERARAEMLRAGGVSHAALMATGGAIVVSRLSIRYLRPLRLEETLEVLSRIRDSAAARVTLEQVIIRKSERVAEMEVELVYLGPHGRPLRWPDSVRRALERKDSPV